MFLFSLPYSVYVDIARHFLMMSDQKSHCVLFPTPDFIYGSDLLIIISKQKQQQPRPCNERSIRLKGRK